MDTVFLEAQRAAFVQMFEAGLASLMRGDVDGWTNMWAEDGKMEFPFGPEGYIKSLDDKTAIREYMREYPEKIRIERLNYLDVYQTLDPGVVVVEFGVDGQALQTGNAYTQRYVAVVSLRDGQITNYRDYWNPLVAIQALGGNAETLAAAFGGETTR